MFWTLKRANKSTDEPLANTSARTVFQPSERVVVSRPVIAVVAPAVAATPVLFTAGTALVAPPLSATPFPRLVALPVAGIALPTPPVPVVLLTAGAVAVLAAGDVEGEEDAGSTDGVDPAMLPMGAVAFAELLNGALPAPAVAGTALIVDAGVASVDAGVALVGAAAGTAVIAGGGTALFAALTASPGAVGGGTLKM